LLGARRTALHAVLVAAALLLAAPAAAGAQAPSFGPPVNYPSSGDVGQEPVAIASGDFDSDDDGDLVTANGGGDNASVLFNNGQGAFSGPAVPVGLGDAVEVTGIAAGDLNGDSLADFVTANTNNLAVVLSTGNQTFAQASNIPITGGFPYAVAISDLDGDGGSDDLAVALSGASQFAVLLGNGQGGFGNPVLYPLGNIESWNAVSAGDLNGDGNMDLAFSNSSFDSAASAFGTGGGAFGGPIPLDAGAPQTDILITAPPPTTLQDLKRVTTPLGVLGKLASFKCQNNCGGGTAASASTFGQVQTADLPGSGDIVAIDAADDSADYFLIGGINIFADDDELVFVAPLLLAATRSNPAASAGGGAGSQGQSIPVNLTGAVDVRDVVLADLTGDGLTDGATANFGSNNVSVVINLGSIEVRCGARRPTVLGSPRRDRISGTRQVDVLAGRGASDVVTAKQSGDRSCGAAGDDRVSGGRGADALYGNRGDDRLKGGRGNDNIHGGRGFDRCHGGPGRNTFHGCEIIDGKPA
jgi:Ca2+-binding RTX toxin-like protein